jgi:hypothetical protein
MRKKKMNKHYYPKCKNYLTPNEKWYLLKGILIGICIGLAIAGGVILSILY